MIRTEPGRKGNWMQTYTGKKFWPLDPLPEEIDIEDIAHALSMKCRYNGHVKFFYSVAEHSCIICDLLPQHLKLQGLLHDAPEAYLVDIPRPLKPFLTNYAELEALNWAVISDKYGVPFEFDPLLKELDNGILLTERDYLMDGIAGEWGITADKPDVIISGWSPETSKFAFLQRFGELV